MHLVYRSLIALLLLPLVVPAQSDEDIYEANRLKKVFTDDRVVATLVGAYYPALALLLFAWAVLVGMARVVLGVHFPSDTLIGALMGASLACISLEALAQ